ncbi:MAG: DHH family phosphoesterase [Lachnospiraceae bacterium]|nr:DHH family phosphoesterase [Lachnospiraceae bacterium]
MKNNIKLNGQLKSYLRWPLLLIIFWVVMVIGLFFIDIIAGLASAVCLLIYVAAAWLLYVRNRSVLLHELIIFAANYGQVQKQLLKEFIVPYALMDSEGKMLWMNDEFMEICEKDNSYRKGINTIFPEVTEKELPGVQDKTEVEILFEGRDYRAAMEKVSVDGLLGDDSLLEMAEDKNYLIACYLFDETDLNHLKREKEEEKLVCGLIYLDNYDEALESVEEVRRSLLVALIDRKINKYFNEIDGIVRKTEKDKYFVMMRKRSLDALQKVKFSILEEVKTVNIGNEMAVTLSIGIGLNGSSYSQNAEYARVAIELALGRGGDQVVVKNGENTSYYGGKTESVEKNTRVKARVKAHALKEFMSSKARVVVMGHKITDVDTLGAAVGMYRAAKTINKPAYIVVDNPPPAIRPLMSGFLNNPDYDSHMFVTCKEARDIVDSNTVVVVVDTNKPSYTECEELLSLTKTIVVLDHHRQGREVIRNAVLSYIEPYASSACEMVAEVLQYFADEIRIRNIEADCLYAGIMIDTNNFMTRTGVRTFEAAAFLRRCGADVTRVRKMFRDNMEDYRAKAATIARAETFENAFAISVCPSADLDSPTVICAQAANELLNVVGVKASFVMTDYNDTIYISARAIDEVNVQIIMERLGGGGHMNIAGAQLPHTTISEAIRLLKSTLQEMIEEGDL